MLVAWMASKICLLFEGTRMKYTWKRPLEGSVASCSPAERRLKKLGNLSRRLTRKSRYLRLRSGLVYSGSLALVGRTIIQHWRRRSSTRGQENPLHKKVNLQVPFPLSNQAPNRAHLRSKRESRLLLVTA